jgi:hypothetical protein
VYRFYHAKTPALPEGRCSLVLTDGTVILDGPLPYDHIPLFRVAASDITGTSLGFTVGFDLLAIQQYVDSLYSVICTNQELFGLPVIVGPQGGNINFELLSGGVNYIEVQADLVDKIKTLSLLNTSAEIYNTIAMLEAVMEKISGVNAVSRGQAPTSDSSGALAALLQSMTIQFNQDLQWSYTQCLEDAGSHIIQTLKSRGDRKRLATIVGKNNKSKLVEFTGDDISDINRVVVKSGNPMSKTPEGRLMIAQDLLKNKIITTADEYLQVFNTGNLDPLIQGPTNELLGITSENEALMEGQSVTVMVTDNHTLHLQEHKCVLSDPQTRNNPELVQGVLAHIKAHIDILSDPQYAVFMKAFGQQSLAPEGQMPGASPGMPGLTQQGQGENTGAQVQGMMPSLPNAPNVAGTNTPMPLPPGAPIKH